MHGKPAEVSASALDALFGIELETVAIEKWPGCETDVRGDAQGTQSTQRSLDAMVKSAGDTATSEGGMDEEKIQITLKRVRSKARERAVEFSYDVVKARQTLPPACRIRWDWRPGGKLRWRIIRRCQRANRCRVSLDNVRQVCRLK